MMVSPKSVAAPSAAAEEENNRDRGGGGIAATIATVAEACPEFDLARLLAFVLALLVLLLLLLLTHNKFRRSVLEVDGCCLVKRLQTDEDDERFDRRETSGADMPSLVERKRGCTPSSRCCDFSVWVFVVSVWLGGLFFFTLVWRCFPEKGMWRLGVYSPPFFCFCPANSPAGHNCCVVSSFHLLRLLLLLLYWLLACSPPSPHPLTLPQTVATRCPKSW